MKVRDCLKFRGTWRNYQKRVLDETDKYLSDGKIHIVAAPGSGKTTLGIELIGRLNATTLVLVPTITIREQWVSRIKEAFLVGGIDEKIISTDLKNPSLITIATYQALHCSMIRFAGKMDVDEGEEDDESLANSENESEEYSESNGNVANEIVDFSKFDILKEMKRIGPLTICLDECHHLRSEWQKSLEEFVKQVEKKTVISLTATPPYDSTPAMWKKYIDLCGEIDTEITIPELVKEGTLCPHQDYIYFNYPTKEELEILDEYQNKIEIFLKKIMCDEQFEKAVTGHAFLKGNPDIDKILEEPSYLSAILIYLNEKQIPFWHRFLKILGVDELPAMEAKWMEILLQKLLYADSESFACSEEYSESLRKDLKKEGLLEKRKVILTRSTAVEKMLITSKGKSESIVQIAKSEYESLGKSLRMLVLTDYIRKEFEKDLGTDKEIMQLGVLPFFEKLRREKSLVNVKLGVLCGTVVVIPADVKNTLIDLVGDSQITFSKLGFINENEYIKVNAVGKSHFLTAAVTELFKRGCIQIIIGTKSLLGEGWDSPCVNSLILASFVGSYMLSNQMRGRAIRVFADEPNKTSNIWHLVCLKPRKLRKQEMRESEFIVRESEDLLLLKRRMEHFCGLHYTENTIESGIERISHIGNEINASLNVNIISAKNSSDVFTPAKVARMNEQTILLSKRRDELRSRWQNSLEIYEKMEVVNEVEVEKVDKPVALFVDLIRYVLIMVFFSALQGSVYVENEDIGILVKGALMILFILLLSKCPKLFALGTPYRILKRYGNAVKDTLYELNMLEDNRCKVEAETLAAIAHVVYLSGGSSRDKEVFAQCMSDMFMPVDNQRYIMVRKRIFFGKTDYFNIPEAFSKNKEAAQCFQKHIERSIGKYELVYTRNEEGRKILLVARAKAFGNKQNRFRTRKKVKGALE